MITQTEQDFFENNVMPHYEYIVKKLTYLSSDIHLANDIAQDVMLDTFNSITRVKTYDNIKAYLVDAAKKKLLKHRKKYQMREFVNIDDVADEITTGNTIEEIVSEIETRAELAKMLKQLDEEYRQVLVLHYYYKMSLKEIADTMGQNYNTVRSWHKRAIDDLKDLKVFLNKLQQK